MLLLRPRSTRGGELMRVAVTGANGFVGRHAISRLLLGGHAVRALISERPGAEKELPGAGAEMDVRRGDVRKPESLRGAFDGFDAVIHTVAVPTERKQKFADVNVAGVAHVVAGARSRSPTTRCWPRRCAAPESTGRPCTCLCRS